MHTHKHKVDLYPATGDSDELCAADWNALCEDITEIGTVVYIYDLVCYLPVVPDVSDVVARWAIARNVAFPAGMTGSRASAGVAATAQTIYTVKKNGSAVATITWAISGTTGTYAAALAWSVVPGDVVTIEAPASPDATLAQVSITMIGIRTP